MGRDSSRRGFLIRAGAGVGALLGRSVAALLPAGSRKVHADTATVGSGRSAITHGPFVGHLTSNSATIWARCASPGVYRLNARGRGTGSGLASSTMLATPCNDLCIVWHVTGLQPHQKYVYEIAYHSQDKPLLIGEDFFFVTPPADNAPAVTRLALGSCALEDAGSAAVWRRMKALDPHAIVLLGDTPYIDCTELDAQRTRYRDFAAVPDFTRLLRNRPLYATWDDHDFGIDDTDGRLTGKENSRRAFIEYHSNPSYGERREGIYTKFRHAGVEVFLLDTRYFAGTEPSPVAEGQPTLLGAGQWEWLRRELRASSAPFKLLASGMIWNGAVRPGKPDHWDSYPHERDALFRFIGAERISGVVLVGGDIHRTRVLRHDTTGLAGYPLTELVTSPIHDLVSAAANAPHAALIYDSGEPHSFLLVTVDTTANPPTLLAQFQNAAGRELYALTLDAAILSAARL